MFGLCLEVGHFLGATLLWGQLFGLFFLLHRDCGHFWWRRWEGDVAFKRDGRATDHIVFHVVHNLTVLFGGQVSHHVTDVVAIQRRGLCRHPRWEVGVADDDHAVVGDNTLVHLGQFTVAALFSRKVHDDGAGLHHFDHVFGPKDRRGAVRDQRGGDHDVHVWRDLAELFKLLGLEFGARGRRVATCLGTIRQFTIFELKEDELRPHGFDLLSHFGAHVKCVGDRTKAGRCPDRRKTRNARAHNQNLGGGDFTGGCHLTGEEAAKVVACLDHGPVAGDVGHGRQCVHFLGA